jgi:hypothetical protein
VIANTTTEWDIESKVFPQTITPLVKFAREWEKRIAIFMEGDRHDAIRSPESFLNTISVMRVDVNV